MKYYKIYEMCSPQIGFEPMTNRLTVERSTTELLRNIILNFFHFIIAKNFKSFQQQAYCSLPREPLGERLGTFETRIFLRTLEAGGPHAETRRKLKSRHAKRVWNPGLEWFRVSFDMSISTVLHWILNG